MKRRGIKANTSTEEIFIPSGPRLLPFKEAAKYLGFSEWGMREAVYNGLIPVVKYPQGRKWWFDVNDLELFITRNKYKEYL